MSAPAQTDPPFESDAVTLAGIWLDPRRSLEQAQHDAGAVVARAQARGDTQLALLSSAFELVHIWITQSNRPDFVARTEATLARLRAAGWERATRLAETMWAQQHAFLPQRKAEGLALMLAQGDAAQDPRPAVERVWTDSALCILLCANGRFDEALASGLRAEALAEGCPHDMVHAQTAQNLAYVFLSVGDIEGACAVLPKGLEANRRAGSQSILAPYNLLLALVVGRRFDEAAAVLERQPWLCEAERLNRTPALRALVARVRLGCGQRDEAAALLRAEVPTDRPEPVPMRANRLWVTGDVLLALGRAQEARELVAGGIGALEAAGAVLSPMNATQMHRVLSEACEATGDLREALAAFRRSQAACFAWVGDSMRSRLQAMHLGTEGANRELHAQRLDALNLAVAQARRQSGEQAAERHSRFMAQVTDEMRSPLRGVIGMTSLLMMSDLDARQRQVLNLARSSAHMLMALCNDVLDLARIEAGQFELAWQAVDVAGLVAEVAQLWAPQAEAGGLRLHWQVDPALPAALLCDRLRLQQVLMNLLGNAVKFTRQGSVELRAGWQPGAGAGAAGELRVSVRDTGPGLASDERERLFKEFSQAHAGVAQAHGGTGLGLALCRSLLTLMGGAIDVDSAPGQGSTFWFTLPLRPVAAAPAPAAAAPA